jgi:thiosulfate/3-mercaptopyruvate sulfurtransferase
MPLTTLIEAEQLLNHLEDENWAVIDCRFSLDNTEQGRVDYLVAHIPGAVYAHLDRDLSGKAIFGKTGRHPLPSIPTFAGTLSRWGIDATTQVVVYDDSTGAIAARLWWMLNWMGHQRVALLDGGWKSWCHADFPSRSGEETRTQKCFEPHEIQEIHVSAEQVLQAAGDPRYLILDARSTPRYLGELEPIDPVAGHIEGAISAPYEENLTPEGRFHSSSALCERFRKIMKAVPPENVICYCGSGVTAAQNLLAMAHAGLGMGRLYAGSWSEWITNPARPVAKGAG